MILQRIEEIIFSGYKEKVSGNIFELKENNKKAKCKKAIFRKNEQALIYKFDEAIVGIDNIFPFLNNVECAKAMCDYIIFYHKRDKLFVFLCNLKSGNKHNCADQWEAGKIFCDFILKTLSRVSPLDIEIKYRRILFSSILLYKTVGKPPKTSEAESEKKVKNYISNDSRTDTCDLDAICH